VAIAPDGTFALLEWSVPAEQFVEPVAPPLQPEEDPAAPLYRTREREPRPIHAQARRRLEALQPGPEEIEEEKRREPRRKFPPPAEVAFEWLAQRQSGAPIAELCGALFKKGLLSDALVRDAPSLVQALLEDNRRRTEAGRKPAFIVDGDRVTLVEFPPPSAVLEEARAPHGVGRPTSAAQLAAESRRAVVRALRRRLADLETAGFERLCAQLLEKMGMRDVRVAKRSKEGPLYLSRQRRGVSDLRTAVKLVRGSREISRTDVQELRRDLAHYSAQMGLVLAPGEAGRVARAEAAAAGLAPVALYAGECLAEEFCALRVGVKVQVVELADVDEALFAEAARPSHGPDRDKRERFSREEPQEEEARLEAEARPAPFEMPPPAEEAAAAPEPVPEPVAVVAPQLPATPLAPTVPVAPPPDAARLDAEREARKRPGRREPQRATNAAEQAWGQPIGTPRRALPPSPLVFEPSPVEPQPASPSSTSGEPATGTPDDNARETD
jgi:hypothetical protein